MIDRDNDGVVDVSCLAPSFLQKTMPQVDELRDAIAAILRAKGEERGKPFGEVRETLFVCSLFSPKNFVHLWAKILQAEIEAFVETIMKEIDVNDDEIMTVEELENWCVCPT